MAPDPGSNFTLLHVILPKLLGVHSQIVVLCNLLTMPNSCHRPPMPVSATRTKSPDVPLAHRTVISVFDALYGDVVLAQFPSDTKVSGKDTLHAQPTVLPNSPLPVNQEFVPSAKHDLQSPLLNDVPKFEKEHLNGKHDFNEKHVVNAKMPHAKFDPKKKMHVRVFRDTAECETIDATIEKASVASSALAQTQPHDEPNHSTKYAIQYSKNYIDLRADLNLVPRGLPMHVSAPAVLDDGGDEVLPLCEDCNPYEDFLDSLSPEEFNEYVMEIDRTIR